VTTEPSGSAEIIQAGQRAYLRVRKGFASVELAHLGVLGWSLVVTQVRGYDAPLWSGAPGVTAIGAALYALMAIILLALLWGLVRAVWAGVYWRRQARLERRG
jgi:hypothetical protein